MQAHDVACLHTMVGTLSGTSSMFHQNGYGGTESHFGMGHDGRTLQWQDLTFEADANGQGNHRVISMETADKGAGFPSWTNTNVPRWTTAQLDSIVAWLLWVLSPAAHATCSREWACHGRGIPPVLIPDTHASRRGIGYHRQGVDSYPTPYRPGWRQPGCERWSPSVGKVCPGDRRVEQLIEVVIPRVQAALTPIAPTLPEEDDVFLYSTPGQPVFFCAAGASVGLNEASDLPTFQAAKVPHFSLDNDTYEKFRQRFPGA